MFFTRDKARSRGQQSKRWRNSLRLGLAIIGIVIVSFCVVRFLIPTCPTPNSTPTPNLASSIKPQDDPRKESPQDDPKKDGWDSEVLTNLAIKELKKVAKVLMTSDGESDEVEGLIAPDFVGSDVRPSSLERVFDDHHLGIWRLAKPTHATTRASKQKKLPGKQWLEAVSSYSSQFTDLKPNWYEVKITRIDLRDGGFSTDARFQLSATGSDSRFQCQGVWHCEWQQESRENSPTLVAFDVAEYEEVLHKRIDGLPWFLDCTSSIFDGVEIFEAQFLVNADVWLNRMLNVFGYRLDHAHGIAIGDANGDGRDDVYICEPGGLPNRLFVQSENLRVADSSSGSGADLLDYTSSALFLDLDNDGDQDLVVATSEAILFLENSGHGRFSLKEQVLDMVNPRSIASADFDLDGFVDVFVCCYGANVNSEKGSGQTPIPYYDANNGGRNVLIRNSGEWSFDDVTDRVGLTEGSTRWSYAASWEDFDNDGDMDLYVANDFGRNCLYQNDSGQFSNVAVTAGVEDVGSGMSVAWGDYNRDGLMDLYISNMFSSAGSRIGHQNKFKPDVTQEEKALLQRMAKGSTLFTNVGNGKFVDDSHSASVAMARWAWGAPFGDLNNDGWEDLIVGNGMITRKDSRDL